jgi:hypothetical protein
VVSDAPPQPNTKTWTSLSNTTLFQDDQPERLKP